LLIAAVFAAAMSSVDSSLNCSATLFLQDIYKRYIRRKADVGERESMWVLYLTTLVWGAAGTMTAMAMIHVKSALDAWWQLAGIFSGGMLGLFLLGLIAHRAKNAAAATGVVIGVLIILWMSLSARWGLVEGTASIDRGSTVVAGKDTHFYEELRPGDEIVIADVTMTVESINDNQQLTVTQPFSPDDVKREKIFKKDTLYRLRSPFHGFMTIVVGTLTILLVGLAVSRFTAKEENSEG